MTWNWKLPDWPNFAFEPTAMLAVETAFLKNAGVIVGTLDHVANDERQSLILQLAAQEVLDSSAIEGEILDRDSVQSSLARHLGLAVPNRRVGPKEAGAAELMSDVYRNFTVGLDHQRLVGWHGMLMNGRRDLASIGRYRDHADAMQIVSGPIGRETVHFEAPPSAQVYGEMVGFLDWFAASGPAGSRPVPAVTRAAIAHLWFESIHPFEDGNGRIGRAIAELALTQSNDAPSLTVLSEAIKVDRRGYYEALRAASLTNQIDAWLAWFGGAVLEAQRRTRRRVSFVIAKSRMFARLGSALNPRQERALLRLFEAGPDGFGGGMSASNYQTITKASAATATRDLVELVELGAVTRTGDRRTTRYWLAWEMG